MYTLIRFNPAEIDLSSEAPFRFRFVLPHEEGATGADPAFITSIEKLGVLNPPLLIRKLEPERPGTDSSSSTQVKPTHSSTTGITLERSGNDSSPSIPSSKPVASDRKLDEPELVLLSGYRRVSAALATGIPEIEGLVIDSIHETEKAVDIWLHEALTGSKPSEIEKVILIEKLRRLSGNQIEKYLEQLSAIFQRKVSGEYASEITEILKEEESTLAACHSGAVRADELLRMRLHPAIDQSMVASLLAKIDAGSRERKEILHLIEILGGKDPEALNAFMEKIDGTPSAPGNISRELRKLVYPTLSSYEESLKKLAGGIGLPTFAAISYPENLEGASLTLTVRFRRTEELKLVVEKLTETLSSGTIDEMLSILRGNHPEIQ